MFEVTVINPIEMIEQICQSMTELKDCIGEDMTGTVKMHYYQVNKSLAMLRAELLKLGYSEFYFAADEVEL